MPQAVTHFLIAAILVGIIRDFLVKDKKSFPLHLVLIGGLAGLLPDIDFAVFYILQAFGFSLNEVHRTLTHTIFFTGFFFIIGILLFNYKNKYLEKRHLKLANIFLIISLGIFTHLLLDAIIIDYIKPFYPLSDYLLGLNLVNYLPEKIAQSFTQTLDAALLILWMIYLELKHKISDFI